MIAVGGLDHVGIRVSEFARTVNFFQLFGFGVIREDPQERIVVLRNAAGVEINLLDSANTQLTGSNILMDQAIRHPGFTHIALQVEDIDYALRDIESVGITITEGPVTFGDGKTSIFLRDPDRNVIELTQLPVFQKLRHEGEAVR